MNLRIAVGFLLTILCFSGVTHGQQEPAGEGRVITPAGTLVKDAATQLPAVGAMPMTMLRSTDKVGPGGKGRYLLVVNSGYGVQFKEETNHAQQSPDSIALPGSTTGFLRLERQGAFGGASQDHEWS